MLDFFSFFILFFIFFELWLGGLYVDDYSDEI